MSVCQLQLESSFIDVLIHIICHLPPIFLLLEKSVAPISCIFRISYKFLPYSPCLCEIILLCPDSQSFQSSSILQNFIFLQIQCKSHKNQAGPFSLSKSSNSVCMPTCSVYSHLHPKDVLNYPQSVSIFI